MDIRLTAEAVALFASIREGDEKAFDDLFRKFYPLLCMYCSKWVSMEDAEEIVQDSLMWFWENRQADVLIDAPLSYLFRMVYHRALNRITQQEIRQRAESKFFMNMQNHLQEMDYYQMQEMTRHIREAINALPLAYQTAFKMSRFQRMTYKEIGDALEVSPKTVAYRIQQALKLLRVSLKDYLFNLLMVL